MDNLTTDIALKQYLFLTEAHGKHKFIDAEGQNLIWAFDNVEHQICYLNSAYFQEDKEDISELADRINNKRTHKISLITNIEKSCFNFASELLFEYLYSKLVFFYQRENFYSPNHSNFSVEEIKTKEHFDHLIKFHKAWPYQIRRNAAQIFLLLDEPFFSLKYHFIEHSGKPEVLILKFELELVTIIEYININCQTSNYSNFVISDLFKESANDQTELFVVLSQDVSPLFHKKNLCERSKIVYYKKDMPPKEASYFPEVSKSGTLMTNSEYLNATEILKDLGIPKHVDLPKNWDSLAALCIITAEESIKKDMAILDAGGEYYSAIMHQLASFGYKNLYCINTVFKAESKVGLINYIPGDITDTEFNDNTFMAITCLSVIEHGVNVEKYLAEMSRILKPGGLLITSTDYWMDLVETYGKQGFGVPVKVFDKTDIASLVALAKKYRLELIDPIVYNCKEKVVDWDGIRFTFIYFTFRKSDL